jgi:hypothetical protein
MTWIRKNALVVALCSALLGCKSANPPQYADITGSSPAAPPASVSEPQPAANAAVAKPEPSLVIGTAGTAASPGTSTTPSPVAGNPPAPARATGTARIIIKGTRAGTSQNDIAMALMAATRKLGTTTAPPDRQRELSMARQAADVILGGDKVVLEGASADTVDAIADDLRKAGLLVTTTK